MSTLVSESAEASAALAPRLAELRSAKPNLYPRDYAAELGISEAELTPLFYGERVQQLRDVAAVFSSLSRLPRIKLMARVSYAVLEIFSKVDFSLARGLLVSDVASCYVALDPTEIGSVFFLSPEKAGDNAAILLFDLQGIAALKLYIASHEFDAALLVCEAVTFAAPEITTAAALSEIRQKYMGEPGAAFVAATDAPRQLIESAAAENRQMAFEILNNAVAVLIRHVPQKVLDARGWLNILDADFNLHLREEAISRLASAGDAQRQILRLENAAGEAITIYSTEKK